MHRSRPAEGRSQPEALTLATGVERKILSPRSATFETGFMAERWSLRELPWRELAKRTCRESWNDEVFGQSARLSFYFFFAIFPVLLLLLIFLSKSAGAGSELRAALLDSFKQVLPPDASALIATTIRQLNAKALLGHGAILGGLSATWGALNGTWAVMIGLNNAYGIQEDRPWWRALSVAFVLTIGLSILGLIALAAILYGNRAGDLLGHNLGIPAHFDFLWRILQWIVIVVLMLCSFALIYRFGPNLKHRRWRWSLPGAAVAAALWVIFALLLRIYQEHFSSSRVYGGMSAVATLLLWLYLSGAAVFIGGELNSEIEKAEAAAGNPDAEGVSDRQTRGQPNPGL